MEELSEKYKIKNGLNNIYYFCIDLLQKHMEKMQSKIDWKI